MDIKHLRGTKNLQNTSIKNNITTKKKHGRLFFNKRHFVETHSTLIIEQVSFHKA